MELDATSLYVIRRHKDLSSIYGAAENAVTTSAEYFERMIESVTDKIEGNVEGKDFLWGSCFSELDILMTVCLDWATFVGVNIPSGFQNYRKSMANRIAYRNAQAFNYSNLQIPQTK